MNKKLIALPVLALALVACGPKPNPHPTPTPVHTTVSPKPTPTVSPIPTVAPTNWPPIPNSCGFERWPVKTGTDSTASQINLSKVTDTTIAAMNQLTAPSNLPQSSRLAPVETTVYRIHATLVMYKMENDSDIHLVLNDSSGGTMIAEIPYPLCVQGSSPLLTGIENARSEFQKRFTPSDSFQNTNVPVTVTGVGFFDFLHGQTGVADNGVELHPVLDVQFNG